MLSYALAIAVALSSSILFLTAFVMSDIHRKDDFLWSGVGLLYALVLWFCARNITGTVLLGQAAASILLVSFCWQTLKLRKAIANPERASEINDFSILQATIGLLNRKKSQPQVTKTAPQTEILEKVEESEISIPETPAVSDVATSKSDRPEKTEVNSEIKNSTLETKVKSTTPPPATTDKTTTPVADDSTKQPVEKAKTEIIVEQPVDPATESTTTDEKIEATPQQPEKNAEVTPIATSTTTESELPSSTPKSSKSAMEKTEAATKIEEKPTIVETKSPSPTEPESDTENPPITENSESQVETPEEKPSTLDSLETVEVAEVLEAVPESTSRSEIEDSNNIIEVTTTEIEPKNENTDSKES